jgi:hypothetical protein
MLCCSKRKHVRKNLLAFFDENMHQMQKPVAFRCVRGLTDAAGHDFYLVARSRLPKRKPCSLSCVS